VNLTQLTAKVMGLANRLAAPDTWHLFTLQNSWTNSGSGVVAQYRYTSDNGVWIVANIIPGTVTNGTVVFTLPTGYRPQQQICFPVGVQTSLGLYDANDRVSFLAVNTDGTCALFGVNPGSGGTTSFVHIDGIVPLDNLN
jgi:hypothetical protein